MRDFSKHLVSEFGDRADSYIISAIQVGYLPCKPTDKDDLLQNSDPCATPCLLDIVLLFGE